MIQILTDQDQLIFRFLIPPGIILQGESLAGEVEDVALGAFLKPQNSFGAKHFAGQLIIQELLEFLDRERAITGEGDGDKPIVL